MIDDTHFKIFEPLLPKIKHIMDSILGGGSQTHPLRKTPPQKFGVNNFLQKMQDLLFIGLVGNIFHPDFLLIDQPIMKSNDFFLIFVYNELQNLSIADTDPILLHEN